MRLFWSHDVPLGLDQIELDVIVGRSHVVVRHKHVPLRLSMLDAPTGDIEIARLRHPESRWF
jgi:hypothetical protein